MTSPRLLRLTELLVSRHCIHLRYAVDDLRFSNALWYEAVDLYALREKLGPARFRNVTFHASCFELAKLVSLRPDVLDWGPCADLVTDAFAQFWRQVVWKDASQWRFENDLSGYEGPDFQVARDAVDLGPSPRDPQAERVLALFGGGKDSLLATRLLEACRVEYDTFSSANSLYGQSARQHALIARALEHTKASRKLRHWVMDDYLDSPVHELRADLGPSTTSYPETASLVFAALPFALHHGHSAICMANERSADSGQAVNSRSGEIVNHQWGKSKEAELLFSSYIERHLIEEFSCFSILKPISDVAIFGALRGVGEAAAHTHSCNLQKPWCMRCPKCLYVWLGFSAFLDEATVTTAFGPDNLLDRSENVPLLRQLIGLEQSLPFECVGEAGESLLYLAMCVRRGKTGVTVDACRTALERFDLVKTLERYLAIEEGDPHVPPSMWMSLRPELQGNAERVRAWIGALFSGAPA